MSVVMQRLSDDSKTNLNQEKLEGNAMRPVDLVLEMEHLDEVGVLKRQFFSGNSLSIDLSIVAQIQNRVVSWGFSVDPVRASLIYPDRSCFSLIGDLGFLDQGLD